jgi:cell division protein FtsL
MMTHRKQTMREKKQAVKRMLLSTSFRVFLTVLVSSFSVLYVAQTSSVSTKGYDINDLQREITQLQRENQKLDFQIAQYRSMQSIKDRLEQMDLVIADNIEYVTLVGNSVARR